MNVYLDSSVVLRFVMGQPGQLAAWSEITNPISSELLRIECLRTIDNARIRYGLDDDLVAARRAALMQILDRVTYLGLDPDVLQRAAEPFPTLVGSLDALHLASALLAPEEIGELALATHDDKLATAATALGFDVLR